MDMQESVIDVYICVPGLKLRAKPSTEFNFKL